MVSTSSTTDPKLPGNMACWLRLRNNRSTMFIHEALVGSVNESADGALASDAPFGVCASNRRIVIDDQMNA